MWSMHCITTRPSRRARKGRNTSRGHSLGEYDALLAAGVFDFLTGLAGWCRSAASDVAGKKRRHGGRDRPRCGTIAKVINDNGLSSVDRRQLHTPTQTVVSGRSTTSRKPCPFFEKAGHRCTSRCRSAAAFHSRYMADAAKAFADFVAPMSSPRRGFRSLQCQRPSVSDRQRVESVKSLLVGQITKSVQWTQKHPLPARPRRDAVHRARSRKMCCTRMVQQIQQQQKVVA